MKVYNSVCYWVFIGFLSVLNSTKSKILKTNRCKSVIVWHLQIMLDLFKCAHIWSLIFLEPSLSLLLVAFLYHATTQLLVLTGFKSQIWELHGWRTKPSHTPECLCCNWYNWQLDKWHGKRARLITCRSINSGLTPSDFYRGDSETERGSLKYILELQLLGDLYLGK